MTVSTDFELMTEIGGVGLKRSGGWLNEEFLPKLSGNRAQSVFREMYDNDPIIGASCYAVDILLRGAPWHTEPADDSPQALECSDFVDSCFNDMTITHSDWLQQVLSCVPYGWVFFEQCFKERRGENDDSELTSKYNDGRLGFSKLALRSQDSMTRWEFDDNDRVLGLWQRPNWNVNEVFIPARKSVSFVLRGQKNSPEGRSMLRSAYRPWFFKKRLEEIEAIGLERDLNGYPVMQVPPALLRPAADLTADQASALAAVKAFVTGIRVDDRMGGLLPSEVDREGNPTGYKLVLLSTGSRNAGAIQASIVRYEQRMAMTFLAGWLMMGMDKVGSYSLHSSATDLFGAGLGSMLDTIEQGVNETLVANLCKLNGFRSELWPKRKHGDVETMPLSEIAGFISSMVGSGVVVPDKKLEEYARELGTLPAIDEETQSMRDMVDMLPEGVQAVVEPTGAKPAAQPATTATSSSATPDAKGSAVFEGLNGAQLSSVLDLLERMVNGQVTEGAASILIEATGVPADKAAALVAAMRGAKPLPTETAPAAPDTEGGAA